GAARARRPLGDAGARPPARRAARPAHGAGSLHLRLALSRALAARAALLARIRASTRLDADPYRLTLPRVRGCGHTVDMRRRHQRLLAGVALGLLVLVAEIAGGSLTHRIDVGRHVGPVSYSHRSYYPFLLAGVKVGVALMLARLTWRFGRARRVA